MNNQIKLYFSLMLIVLSTISYSQTVYVTKNGKKYHTENCRYNKNSLAISLPDASNRGYEPCSICNPPTNYTNRQSLKNTRTTPQSTSSQCTGLTKSGNRCKHLTKSSNGKCYQHGGN